MNLVFDSQIDFSEKIIERKYHHDTEATLKSIFPGTYMLSQNIISILKYISFQIYEIFRLKQS